MTIIDLFCGTGGFSNGFAGANKSFRTSLGIDLLAVATQTFKANHPTAMTLAGDIRKMRRADICEKLKLRRDDIDVIIGGPPCQGFSSIRPFRSSLEDDPRNSLFEEFASFVNFFRPKVFVMENVIGLATYRNGEVIAKIQDCFRLLGYDAEWRILNAAHFGVPQKRERLILIGAQRGLPIRFPEPTHRSDSPTIGFRHRVKMQTPQPNLFRMEATLPEALTVMDAISDLPPISSGGAAFSYTEVPRNLFQAERRLVAKQLTLHSSTSHTPKMLEIIRHSGRNINSIPKGLIKSGFSSCYSRLSKDEPAVTITVNFVHPASNRCIHPVQDRALTPREGARLQSFDDHFVFAGNRSQVTKQIGNAVPPLLGRALGACVAEMLR